MTFYLRDEADREERLGAAAFLVDHLRDRADLEERSLLQSAESVGE